MDQTIWTVIDIVQNVCIGVRTKCLDKIWMKQQRSDPSSRSFRNDQTDEERGSFAKSN